MAFCYESNGKNEFLSVVEGVDYEVHVFGVVLFYDVRGLQEELDKRTLCPLIYSFWFLRDYLAC